MNARIILVGSLVAASTLLVACEVNNGTRKSGSRTDRYGRSNTTTSSSSSSKTSNKAQDYKNASANRGKTTRDSAGLNWKGHAFPTGDERTSAVMLSKGTPSEVSLNSPFEYQLKVTNLTAHNLEDVVVTDSLPAKFTLKSASPTVQSRDKGVARWVFPKLAPRESKTILVTGMATGQGNLNGCSTVTYDSSVCSTIAVVQPAIEIAKYAPSQALLCEKIPVRYVVKNTGTGIARNVRVSEDLSANLSTANRRPVRFTIDSLAPGKSREFKVDVQAAKTGTFNGRAMVQADGNLKANSAVTTTVVKEPILKVAASGPKSTFLGREVTYDIVVSNTGDAACTQTQLHDSIPAGAKFVSATNGGRVSGRNVVWNVGTIAPRAERKFSVTYKSERPGMLQTSAVVKCKCANEARDIAQTNMVGIPAILLEVIDVEDPIAVGANETYEIRVTNQGTAPGTGIKVKCLLEKSMKFLSTSGPTQGQFSGGAVTFGALASLGPKKTVTWKVVVKAVEKADARFTVKMITDQQTRSVDETEATNFYK